jgi:hypothetical protein
MAFDVTMRDGTVIKNVPDGTTKAQIAARYTVHAKTAAKPALGGFWGDVGRRSADNMAALVEGAAGLPDMAATALGKGAGMVANGLGWAVDKIVPPTMTGLITGERAGDALRNAGNELSNPVTIAGLARRVAPEVEGNGMGRAIGQGLGGVVGGVGGGMALAKASGPVARGIGASLAAQPRAQTIGGVAGSVAAEAARQAGAPIPVQIGAAILGGGVTPAAFDSGATGIKRVVAPLVSGDYVNEQAARLLKGEIVGGADAVAARIRMATARAATSGAMPTTAEVAGDAGLAGFQRTLGDIDGKAGARISGRLEANTAQRLRVADESFGQGRAGALQEAGARNVASADDSIGAAVGRVGPQVAPDVSGEALRLAMIDRAEAARKSAGAQYRNLPGGDEPLQVGAVDLTDNLPRPVDPNVQGRIAFEADGLASQKRVADERGGTLASWVVKNGGIKPTRWNAELGFNDNAPGVADLLASGVSAKSRPGIFNAKGKTVEELYQSARADGWFADAGDGVDSGDFREFVDALSNDIHASGKGGAGSRVRSVDGAAAAERSADNAANVQWWDQQFDERGLSPAKMTPDDWDAMYRDVRGVEPQAIREGETAANDGAVLSDLQASVLSLKSQFFGDDVVGGAIGTQVAKLVNADVRSTKDVERISRNLREAAGRADTPTLRAYANSVADSVDGFLQSSAPPERVAALKDARKAWFAYKTDFGTNEAGRILDKDNFGRLSMDSAKVPGAAVPRNETGATAGRRLLASAGPEASEKATREELRRALDAAGTDRSAIARVEKGYGPLLADMPGLGADVAKAREAAALAETMRASPLGRLRDADDPSRAIGRLLAADDGGGALRRLIGQVANDDEAASGLRRSMAEYVSAGATSRAKVLAGGASGRLNNGLRIGIKTVLDKTARTGLLTREQRQVLLNIHRETKSVQFALTANRTAGSSTVRNVGAAGKMVALALRANPKTSGAKAVYDVVISAIGRADQIRQLATDAMLDPNLAAQLLESPTPDRVNQVMSRIQAYGQGATIGGAVPSADYSAASM